MFEEDESTVMIPTFAPGSFFADRYRIDMILGAGAMGRVYAATEIHSDRRVALKVLHGERLAEHETVERFKREAEVLASIGHPCIVDIYAFHKTPEGIPFLAMELLEGVTLKTRLQNAGRFEDPGNLQDIIDCIASALEAAHDADVVHRDLKPDNIFLPATGTPRAKLVDFGLSRVAKQDKSLTASGMIIGTPRYMAPEQIKDARKTGPESDIYSFGVIVYECLTGSSPYPAQDYGQLLGCLLEGKTTPFESLRPDLPRFVEVFRRALAPEVADRYASAGELADGYAEALGRPSKRDAIDAQTKRPRRKRSKSLAGMVPSRASTLAWDATAARGALAELEKGPPPGMNVDPEAMEARAELGFAKTPELGIQKGSWEDPAPPPGMFFDEASVTEPSRPEAMGIPPTAVGLAPPSQPPPPMIPHTPAPYTPAPQTPAPVEPTAMLPSTPPPGGSHASYPVPPDLAVKAQGGDTLYLGDASLPMQYAPPPPATPSFGSTAPAPSTPSVMAGAPPKKKGNLGVILFLVALLLVVVLSALGGFALRAHMRSEAAERSATE